MTNLGTLSIAIVVSLAAPLRAEFTDDHARLLAAEARELQEAGHYSESIRLVSQAVPQCEDDLCRSRLAYTQGYLHGQESLRVSEAEARPLLELAAARYAEVLEWHPQHWPTMMSLIDVYAQLGDERRAEVLLQDALYSGDLQHRGMLALALGDLFLRQDRRIEAVEAYRVAVDALPGKSTPKRREIQASGELLSSLAGQFLGRLQSWEEGDPDTAMQGYEMMVAKVWEIDLEIAEAALLGWLHLTRRATDTPPDVQRLLADWEPVRELLAFVVEPSAGYFSDWWFENPKRTDALADFMLALGQAQESLLGTVDSSLGESP